MNKIVGALTASLLMAAFASGCATTESLTASERRAAVDEAVLEVDQDQVAVSDEDYDPNEMICKTRRASGSRLGKYRDCRTAREWRRSMSNAAMSATGIGNSGVARSSQ